jgi:CheY-like chemotaxis protein
MGAHMLKRKLVSASKRNILIVEDNDISAVLLQEMLKESGYINIFIAKNGKEAIALFSDHLDLIFMDINLPDTNGIELTKLFQKSYQKKDVPIICYSTDFLRREKECITAGMVDFLPKPLSHKRLKQILECWLPTKKPRAIRSSRSAAPKIKQQ